MPRPLFHRRQLHIIPVCVPQDPVILRRDPEAVLPERLVNIRIEPFPQIHILHAPGEPDHTPHEPAGVVRLYARQLFKGVLEALLPADPAEQVDRIFHRLPPQGSGRLDGKVVPRRLVAQRREPVPLHPETDRFLLIVSEPVVGIDVNEHAHSERLLIFHPDLGAVVADPRDHIRVLRTGLPVEDLEVRVLPDMSVQILHQSVVVGPRHHDIHVVVPGDKSLVAHRADQRPVHEKIAQAQFLAQIRHRAEDLQRNLLRLIHREFCRRFLQSLITHHSCFLFVFRTVYAAERAPAPPARTCRAGAGQRPHRRCRRPRPGSQGSSTRAPATRN